MNRPRKKPYQGLPPYLHFDKSHHVYRYKHPNTGKYHYLGQDKAKAVSATLQLNSILMAGQDLVAKVLGTSPTLDQYLISRFEKDILTERDLAQSTKNDYLRKIKHIKIGLGDKQVDAISVKDIADFLMQFPPTQANRYRALLSIIFKHAVAEGLCSENPSENTMNRRIIKQRIRLNLEGYLAIYQYAEPWLRNAMDLALLTLQRREDIAQMKFADIKDGFLYVIQKKTEKHGSSAYIKIKIGDALAQLIDRCTDDLSSPFLIHRSPTRITWKIKSSEITKVTPDYISKAFASARDASGYYSHLTLGQNPTYHEIRSLGIKLYEDAGIDAQALAGHKSRTMTDHYKAGHDKWTEADACLSLPDTNMK